MFSHSLANDSEGLGTNGKENDHALSGLLFRNLDSVTIARSCRE